MHYNYSNKLFFKDSPAGPTHSSARTAITVSMVRLSNIGPHCTAAETTAVTTAGDAAANIAGSAVFTLGWAVFDFLF